MGRSKAPSSRFGTILYSNDSNVALAAAHQIISNKLCVPGQDVPLMNIFLKAAQPLTLLLAQAYFEFCVPLEQVDDHGSVSREFPIQIVTNPAICLMVCSTFAC